MFLISVHNSELKQMKLSEMMYRDTDYTVPISTQEIAHYFCKYLFCSINLHCRLA